MLAGIGLWKLVRRDRREQPRDRAQPGLSLAVLAAQFLWYMPVVRTVGEEAWAARADVAFARSAALGLPGQFHRADAQPEHVSPVGTERRPGLVGDRQPGLREKHPRPSIRGRCVLSLELLVQRRRSGSAVVLHRRLEPISAHAESGSLANATIVSRSIGSTSRPPHLLSGRACSSRRITISAPRPSLLRLRYCCVAFAALTFSATNWRFWRLYDVAFGVAVS